MTAKSSLRSTTGFWLGAQSNKCEGRQTTRRLGRDNIHYGSREHRVPYPVKIEHTHDAENTNPR